MLVLVKQSNRKLIACEIGNWSENCFCSLSSCSRSEITSTTHTHTRARTESVNWQCAADLDHEQQWMFNASTQTSSCIRQLFDAMRCDVSQNHPAWWQNAAGQKSAHLHTSAVVAVNPSDSEVKVWFYSNLFQFHYFNWRLDGLTHPSWIFS